MIGRFQPWQIGVLGVAALIFAGSLGFFLINRDVAPAPTVTVVAHMGATRSSTTGIAVATPGATPSTVAASGLATASRAASGTVVPATPGGPAVAGGSATRAGTPGGGVANATRSTSPTAGQVAIAPTATRPPPTATPPPPTATVIPPTPTPLPPTPTPAPPPLAIAPLAVGHLEYGFNVFLAGNSNGAAFNQRTMAKVRESGVGWVRVQLQWSELEPSPGSYNTVPYDTIMAAASNGGAQVLVSVVKAPAWAAPSRPGALPENTVAFGRTMRYLAARYAGQVQAWEIWNEQNLAGEVGGYVEVEPYLATLKAGYGGVKAGAPGAIVLFGGLTPTGVNDPTVAINDVEYLRAFYAFNDGEGRNYFDVLGAHPGSAANPPDTKFPENPGSGACPPKYASQQGNCWKNAPDFYFRRIEDQRAVMEAFGDGPKQIWLTEFGWDSCQGLPAPNGYEYCALTSEAQQAEYIARAFAIADSWPWMGAMFLWNLNYAATPNIANTDEKYAWSVLRGDWSNRPAFEVVKSLPK